MMLSSLSSKSYSSSMSPTICSSTSSIVTRPDDAAVLVDDDRDVVAVGAEVAQQHVEALRLRHEHRGPQRLAQVERSPGSRNSEQLLGEQDADHVVLVLADHRKARVRGLEHERDELGGLVVDRHDVHLRARDHDVAHRHLGHLQHALDHRQRVGVEQLALERAVQQLEQLLAVLGLARQERRQPLEQRRLRPAVGRRRLIGQRVGPRRAARVRVGERRARRGSRVSRASMRARVAAVSWS